MNDKYKMFKNFLHNELGITKEDIKEWIKEAIKEEACQLVNQGFSVEDVMRDVASRRLAGELKRSYHGSGELSLIVAEILAKDLNITFKESK